MGDTYRRRGVTSNFDGIPKNTRDECAEHRSKTFVMMSLFASHGLCLWDLSEKSMSQYLSS